MGMGTVADVGVNTPIPAIAISCAEGRRECPRCLPWALWLLVGGERTALPGVDTELGNGGGAIVTGGP
jgi:hypothetical protein